MAIQRFTINGYGQLELNQCAFPRTGRIEAQCSLDVGTAGSPGDFATIPAENGMILLIDKVNKKIKLPSATAANNTLLALNYSTEHIHDERANALKDFKISGKDDFRPRLGYLSVGDRFTTNCLCYDSSVFANDAAVRTACTTANLTSTPVYGTASTTGAILLVKSKPASGLTLQAIQGTTMPDGTFAIKFIVIVD